MRALVRHIRDALLATQDTVCLQRARLVTEAYRQHEGDPAPLKRAKAFAHVLRHMSLDVQSNPILAGNTSSRPRAWMLIPEHGFSNETQVLIENDGLDDILEGQIPDDLREFWAERSFGGACGIGHLALDLEMVVYRGLESLIAETHRFRDETDSHKRVYREAMAIALQAVIDWAGRYADAAEAAAGSEPDRTVREAHLRVADACRRVPAKPARNLFEGLQAIVLVHLALAIEGHGMSISIGLPDRVLAPFIDETFNPEYATSLVGAFMLKIAANSVFGRGSKTQAITVGGVDHRGRDQCNALTLCFLEACNQARIGDPHLFLRWHENIDAQAKQRAMEMLAAGVSMPLLIHDEPTAQGFISAGVLEEDAWEYCVIGCNELGIPGRSAECSTSMAGTIQHLELLNETLLQAPDPDAIGSMDELLASLEGTMKRRAFEMRDRGRRHRRRMVECVPTPFTSALMRGCIERGQDFLVGMDYHLPGIYERGLTNAANALAAIQQVVFDEQRLTMEELLEAMQCNFEDASVRRLLLAAPKWGNDDDRADRWARELVTMRERVLDAVDAEFGDAPHMVCHVVRSLHYVDGRRIAASPDGRLACTPVADSIGAQAGTAVNGPTAILNSVLKLDAARDFRGGYNLNLTLPKSTATPDRLLALVEAFSGEGGQELQINCLDAATLRAARDDPAEHQDLVVRVAGFSARFIDLSKAEQEELIARAEHEEGVADREASD
jgi:pyruvate-formate lyase